MGRGPSSSRGKYMQYYQDRNQTISDPWSELANAVVAQAADDYQRLCHKLVDNGARMCDFEFRSVKGRISEIEVFFKSDWGFFLSHGLAPAIWEKLQAEFADGLRQMEEDRKAWIASEEKRIEDEIKARKQEKNEEFVEAIRRELFADVYGEDGDEE